MKYLMKNILITEGTNSRGVYRWLQADLFNDDDIFDNPAQLPRYYNMTPQVIDLFMPAAEKDADLSDDNVSVYKVNESSMKEAIQNGKHANGSIIPGDVLHIDRIFPLEMPLTGVWGRINRRDIVNDKGVVTAKKGEFRKGENGEITPITSITLYLKKNKENNWVDNPQQILARVLERGYRRLTDEYKDAAATPGVATEAPTTAAPKYTAEQIAGMKALGITIPEGAEQYHCTTQVTYP